MLKSKNEICPECKQRIPGKKHGPKKCDTCLKLIRQKRYELREQKRHLTNNKCLDCNKPIKNFKPKIHRVCDSCKILRKLKVEQSRLNYFKEQHSIKMKHKLNSLIELKFICPGCNHNFSDCDEIALFIIFEKCHLHSRTCKNYLRPKNESFYACQTCNRKQRNKCGYFEDGIFIPSCN